MRFQNKVTLYVVPKQGDTIKIRIKKFLRRKEMQSTAIQPKDCEAVTVHGSVLRCGCLPPLPWC
jgi:hypothetical protein